MDGVIYYRLIFSHFEKKTQEIHKLNKIFQKLNFSETSRFLVSGRNFMVDQTYAAAKAIMSMSGSGTDGNLYLKTG